MLISLKRKSTIVALLMMLWSLVAGCAARQSYDELDIESRRTGDTTKIDKREATYKKAVDFLENKAACIQHKDFVWICTHQQNSGRLKGIKQRETSIDGTIRIWRREKVDGCLCTRPRDIIRPRI